MERPEPAIIRRIVSGIQPSGKLHLGNYMGAVRNWIELQDRHDCFFFIADWHALSTNYERTDRLRSHVTEMLLDWLSLGLDPGRCTLFQQSHVLEHAELYLLLGMITPLAWLERNPTYKEQQQQLDQKDLGTYGFLGYPVLQAADIIIYRAHGVPVGKDQLPHVELTREIARRFNYLYKSEIFPVPDGLLTDSPVLPGLDGRKMSKSYGNCIFITDSEKEIAEKILRMMTDPQRVRRHDPGDPELSPVFAYHKLYSSPSEIEEIAHGCRTAAIGCVDCKKILIRNVVSRLAPIRERRLKLESDSNVLKEVIAEGNARAAREASATMELVRRAIGI